MGSLERVVCVLSVALASGCAMLPVRSSTGLKIARVTVVETNWNASRQHPPVDLGGAELAPTVKLLDEHGVLSVPAFSQHDHHAIDRRCVVIAIDLDDGRSMSIDAHNCPEPHICAFLSSATAAGLLDHVPELCTRAAFHEWWCGDESR